MEKCVPIFEQKGVSEHCHVRLLDLYMSKLPKDAREEDFFYARPLPVAPYDPSKPWFYARPVGKNMLNSALKDMCAEAGISGHKTNHSLRATGASEMFEAGVPEKIIKERTSHRSLGALRLYEQTTKDQHKVVSAIHASSNKTTFQQALCTQEQTDKAKLNAQSPLSWERALHSIQQELLSLEQVGVVSLCNLWG